MAKSHLRVVAPTRAAEVCDLRWDQIDFNGAVLHVRRVKNGTPSTHPIQGDELRALRRLQRESPPSPFDLRWESADVRYRSRCTTRK
jgi:integrase